jgi:hypothetical protein
MRALFDGSDGPSALLRMPKRKLLFEGVPEGELEEAQEELQENTKRRTRTENTPPSHNDNGGIVEFGVG